jgi:hypothetical protein
MATAIRPFQAITGLELKKIILAQIEREMDNDCRFRNSVTYPRLTWAWALNVKYHPGEPGEFNIEVSKDFISPGAPEPKTDAKEENFQIGATSMVDAPVQGETADSARREAGLAIPTPRQVKVGGTKLTVDAPEISPTGSEPAPQREPVTNIRRGGKIFGRGVTLKTAAAPDGVEVEPAAGHAPGTEDVQKILKQENEAAKAEAEETKE